ncbi:unnamed protein product [Leptosia nina]|uniref:Uncharacterized protein n=1 Tax=Leptosia nina TaxID=320188 RepID=A0AAV1J9L5_9NEOP
MYIFLSLCLILKVQSVWSAFFHEPSYIEVSPSDEHAKDFGSTITYLNRTLFVGAPHASLNGAVYKCPINEITNNSLVCTDSGINIDKYFDDYNRTLYPSQPFCLGGSVTATKTDIITCAPLWAKSITAKNDVILGAFGTCFRMTGDSTQKYNGLLEYYTQTRQLDVKPKDTPTLDDIYGTFGWTTLVDEVNEIIIFAKPSDNAISRITYLKLSEPNAFPKIVQLDEPGLLSFKYKGRALAPGDFFQNYEKLIAFSMENDKRVGAIGFLSYNSATNTLSVVKNSGRSVLIKEGTVGSMFGSALHSTNINGDHHTDLIVGAPAQACRDGSYEIGAVHIYIGGGPAKDKSFSNLCICGKEDGSRFGTAIASADLDDDQIPEIFISAPYEISGSGKIYVISGYDVKQTLIVKKSIKKANIFIREIPTQELRNENHKAFGYSLQVIPDFESQLSALAIGSPDSQQVAVYRSIPSITVVISIIGEQIVRESDEEFSVGFRVDVQYPKAVNTTAKLLLTVTLVGTAYASINGDNIFTIDLSNNKPYYLSVVDVALNDRDPHTYKLKATMTTYNEDFQSIANYDSSLVRLSQYSKLELLHDITRTCDDNVCRPKLSVAIDWSRGETYILGSSDEEIISVKVQNDGNSSDVSCVWLQVTGAPVAVLECDQPEARWYKCNLLTIGRHEQRAINITLDMKRPTNVDNELRIDVLLYNNCPVSRIQTDYDVQPKIIPYTLNSDDVEITGLNRDQNIEENKILDETSSMEIPTLFMITNKNSVLWKSVQATVSVEVQEFLENLKVQSSDFKECIFDASNLTYNCILDLRPKSTVRVVATTALLKNKIKQNLIDNKLQITTTFELTLSEKLETKRELSTTVLIYREDITFGQQQTYIIVVSCFVAFILLALVTYGLYKIGFFKRQEKKKLERLRSSIRRPPPAGTSGEAAAVKNCDVPPPSPNDSTDLEIVDVTEDILMQNLNSSTQDDAALLDTKNHDHY